MSVVLFYKCKEGWRNSSAFLNFGGTIADNHFMQLSEELHISSKQAMLIFYNSTVGQQLHDPKYGYQLMSDTYIVNDIKAEFADEIGGIKP